LIIQDKKLEAIDPIQASRWCAEHGYLMILNSGAKPEEYAQWALEFGYHVSPDIWCTDKEHSEYFWRVSTEEVSDDGSKGLFGDDELDWHSNLVPHCDAQEIVGIYGKTITYHTETWICTSIPYWHTLSKATQEFYETLKTILWHATDAKPLNQPWKPDWDIKYTDTVMKGIKQNRDKSKVQLCTNIEEDTRAKFNEWRGVVDKHRLVPDHPLGTKGLFFQPYETTSFVQDGVILENSKEIYDEIWNAWICSDKYTYKHPWKPGDIMLMDQTTTIHRRPDVLKDKPRELLRTANWYKAEVRNHYNYVL